MRMNDLCVFSTYQGSNKYQVIGEEHKDECAVIPDHRVFTVYDG